MPSQRLVQRQWIKAARDVDRARAGRDYSDHLLDEARPRLTADQALLQVCRMAQSQSTLQKAQGGNNLACTSILRSR